MDQRGSSGQDQRQRPRAEAAARLMAAAETIRAGGRDGSEQQRQRAGSAERAADGIRDGGRDGSARAAAERGTDEQERK